MRAAIVRPHPVLDPVEAMRLRQNFDLVAQNRHARVIVDLTGVSVLSAAGLAAVTNILLRARRTGMSMRVLLPEQGSDAAQVIDQADLWRFLASGQSDAPTAVRRPTSSTRSVDFALTPA